MMDYSVGIFPAAVVMILIGGVTLGIGLRETESFVGSLMTFVLPSMVASFTLTFSVVNLFSQDLFSLNFYKAELESGILSLRVVSVWIGLKTISNTNRSLLDSNWRVTDFLIRPKKFGLTELDELKPKHDSTSMDLVLSSQYAYYSLIIGSLWYFTINEYISVFTRITSYLLLFIADDWVIISDYYSALKGRIMNNHRLRIVCINLFLGVITSVSLWKFEHEILMIVFICLGILLLLYNLAGWLQDDTALKKS